MLSNDAFLPQNVYIFRWIGWFLNTMIQNRPQNHFLRWIPCFGQCLSADFVKFWWWFSKNNRFGAGSLCWEMNLEIILVLTAFKNPRNRQISMSRVGLKKIPWEKFASAWRKSPVIFFYEKTYRGGRVRFRSLTNELLFVGKWIIKTCDTNCLLVKNFASTEHSKPALGRDSLWADWFWKRASTKWKLPVLWSL